MTTFPSMRHGKRTVKHRVLSAPTRFADLPPKWPVSNQSPDSTLPGIDRYNFNDAVSDADIELLLINDPDQKNSTHDDEIPAK